MKLKLAVLLPCHNEELSIGKTVAAFRQHLPEAEIFVCDNNSSDRTAEVARAAGAHVLFEGRQGKGWAVRRLFSDIDADVYVLCDGDLTYEAAASPKMVKQLLEEHLDMVVGRRVEHGGGQVYRAGHRFGNRLFNTFLQHLFGQGFRDVFSGYRVFSRRFVKSFPVWAKGFEIESEMSIHCLSLGLSFRELDTLYIARLEGTQSKLNKYRDGLRILANIIRLYVVFQPLRFFGVWSTGLALVSLFLMIPIAETYFATGLVPRFPTVIVATGMALLSAVLMVLGLLMHYISRARIETRLLAYLAAR